MAKMIINTHGGIGAETDFHIEVNPGIEFEIEENGTVHSYVCREFKSKPSRQCYKCAFCHGVDLCNHFRCRFDGKLYKFYRLS